MDKTMTKEDFREAVREMVHAVKITSAIVDVERPGAGHLIIEATIDELQKVLPQKTEGVQGACVSEEPGASDCTCDGAVGMTFGDALAALKQSKSVARKGWNGKHQYVELATGISYKGAAGEVVNVHHNNIGNKALAFVGTSGVQMGWLASQADMLAEDWYIVG